MTPKFKRNCTWLDFTFSLIARVAYIDSLQRIKTNLSQKCRHLLKRQVLVTLGLERNPTMKHCVFLCFDTSSPRFVKKYSFSVVGFYNNTCMNKQLRVIMQNPFLRTTKYLFLSYQLKPYLYKKYKGRVQISPTLYSFVSYEYAFKFNMKFTF